MRSGATEADTSRDLFECRKEVADMHRLDFAYGPVWFVAGARAKAKRQRADHETLCMQGRGYTLEAE